MMVRVGGEPPVKVHQCLFGYDDGHRLLASSVQLSLEASSLLLPLSDLAPGIRLGEVEGYWTGVPIPSVKLYALLRTWPAPEMPRPGCVWTHALVLSSADFGRFVDLAMLSTLAVRPGLGMNFDAYREPIIITSDMTGPDTPSKRFGNLGDGLRVLRAVYAPEAAGTVTARAGALDEAVFAVWSQQWPRLRRSFSFRTAASRSEQTASGVRFDLQLLLSRDTDHGAGPDLAQLTPEPWETVAVEDLHQFQPSEFRRYLWRYGSDIRNGRDRFRFLAELYMMTRVPVLADRRLFAALSMVESSLSTVEDGYTLKQDLVSSGRNPYSLLPPSDPLDTIAFFADHSEVQALPRPDDFHIDQNLWATRKDEIVGIAERAAESDSEWSMALLSQLALAFDPATFMSLTQHRPTLRSRLVSANPRLLDSEALIDVPVAELLSLIELAPSDCDEFLIRHLVRLDDDAVAELMHRRAPDITLRTVVKYLDEEGDPVGVGSAWVRTLAKDRSALLNSGMIEGVRSTRTLAALATVLRHDSYEVLRHGPVPWALALNSATDNIAGRDRQTFLAFLLVVALDKPIPGCELLFERAFESVHSDLWHSRFCYEAKSLLLRHLPDLAWWQNWDSCLRLRMGVAQAYSRGHLDRNSFYHLTPDNRLMELLVEAAEETSGGRRFGRRH
jgi:hypothetical protein